MCWDLYQGHATGKPGHWMPALDTGCLFCRMNSKLPRLFCIKGSSFQVLGRSFSGEEVMAHTLAAGMQECKHLASEASSQRQDPASHQDTQGQINKPRRKRVQICRYRQPEPKQNRETKTSSTSHNTCPLQT